ncbi:MAG TPA: agmatine deiminase family protein [Chthoniobacterales bacterium]|nr:agmatine deiminase family protein [Chthoniobacterales bacterium]
MELGVRHLVSCGGAECLFARSAPSRIIPIDCTELIWGLGAFHCLTQQQPAIL